MMLKILQKFFSYIRIKKSFTLVDCIAYILISGMLASFALNYGGKFYDKYCFNENSKRLNLIKDALLDYYDLTGTLPCPSGDEGVNVEDFFFVNKEKTGCNVSCNDNYYSNDAFMFCDGNVAIGTVPGIVQEHRNIFITDWWGYKITYAVDKRFTVYNKTEGKKVKRTEKGDIEIKNYNGDVMSFDDKGGVIFTLVSHGRRHAGTRKTGFSSAAIQCANGEEGENCNRDKVFIQRTIGDSVIRVNKKYSEHIVWGTRD